MNNERLCDITSDDGSLLVACDACGRKCAWAIANVIDEPNGFGSRTDAFACGQHIHSVLRNLRWEMDVVEIRDMTEREPY